MKPYSGIRNRVFFCPNSMKFHWSPLGESDVFSLKDIVNSKNGRFNPENTNIVFAPFDTESCDPIIFSGVKERFLDISEFSKKSVEILDFSNQNFDKYRSSVEQAISDCNKGLFSKIVVSRKKEIIGNIDLKAIFKVLVEQYSNSFVYYFELGGVVYMGATPEELLKSNQGLCSSVSLAGTMLSSTGTNIDIWGAKEKKEQQIVTDYLESKYSKFCSNVTVSERTIKNNGPICHLHNTISGRLKTGKEVNAFLDELHPTPAVCGFPKIESKKWILKNESYDRGFYTGYIGLIEKASSNYYVNLRCLRSKEEITELFVGGGITKDSVVENEFEETEQKLNVLLNAIKKIHTFVSE